MLDTVVRSTRVVTPDGVVPLDIGIQGEVILCLASHGALDGTEILDLGDKIVVPGGIDPHVHTSQPITRPGLVPAEGSAHNGTYSLYSSSPTEVSRAALFGGTTTLVDSAGWQQEGTIADVLATNEKKWVNVTFTDYSEHVMLLGTIPDAILEEIPSVVQSGNPSFKMSTTNAFSGRQHGRVHYGHMLDVLKALAPVGGMAALHCEDHDLVAHAYDRHLAAGDVHFTKMPDVHTDLSEELAIRQVLRLGAAAGCRLYVMHVSSGLGVDAVREARAAGQDVHAETLHQYALFSREHYHRPNGQIYHTYPSLKEAHDCASLWQGLADGTIATVATDGVVTTFEQKMMGDRIDDVTGGSAGIEERMAVTYSGGLNRGMSLTQLAEATSTNAAKLLGMYPRKGVILPGSDADLAVLESRAPAPLKAGDLHQTDYSPWDGHEVRVWPILTMLRGKVVVADGKLLVDSPTGRRAPRTPIAV